MFERQQRLLQFIEQAFHGVELGDGVSLHETIVIDDYGSSEARQAARAADEKHDWRKLVGDPELTRISDVGGPIFYDATGLRFHLPAYLSLAVTDFEREDAEDVLEILMFLLTHIDKYALECFAILDAPQRMCIREVLVYLREVYELEDAVLDQAIQGYWSSGPESAKHT